MSEININTDFATYYSALISKLGNIRKIKQKPQKFKQGTVESMRSLLSKTKNRHSFSFSIHSPPQMLTAVQVPTNDQMTAPEFVFGTASGIRNCCRSRPVRPIPTTRLDRRFSYKHLLKSGSILV